MIIKNTLKAFIGVVCFVGGGVYGGVEDSENMESQQMRLSSGYSAMVGMPLFVCDESAALMTGPVDGYYVCRVEVDKSMLPVYYAEYEAMTGDIYYRRAWEVERRDARDRVAVPLKGWEFVLEANKSLLRGGSIPDEITDEELVKGAPRGYTYMFRGDNVYLRMGDGQEFLIGWIASRGVPCKEMEGIHEWYHGTIETVRDYF